MRVQHISPKTLASLMMVTIATIGCSGMIATHSTSQTASSSPTVAIAANWQTAELLHTLPGHSAGRLVGIRFLSFNTDGTQLMSGGIGGQQPNAQGSYSGTVFVWNPETGALMQQFPELFDEEAQVAMGGDRKTLIIRNRYNQIQLWNLETGERISTLPEQPYADFLHLSQDGRTLIVGHRYDDQEMQVWDVDRQQVIQTIQAGHAGVTISGEGADQAVETAGETTEIALSPDGKTLVTTGLDRVINVWNVETGTLMHSIPSRHGSPIHSFAFSPNGQVLASGDFETAIKLWDVASGTLLRTLPAQHSQAIVSLAFSPSGQILASGDADHNVKLWDVPSGTLIQNLAEEPPREGGSNVSLAFSPNGRLLAGGTHDGKINVWRIAP